MSKNKQKNLSEIHLGNETYSRGFNDGLNGRPKTIKKSHRHAHRYHAGHRQGMEERNTTMRSALAINNQGIQTRSYTGSAINGGLGRVCDPQLVVVDSPVKELVANLGKPKGFWARFKTWLRG